MQFCKFKVEDGLLISLIIEIWVKKMETDGVGKNIWYASFGYLIPSILGYLFLFVATKIVDVKTIGLIAAISSFVGLVIGFNTVNIPAGMRRYLGIAFANKNLEEFKQVIVSALIIVSGGMFVSTIILLIPQFNIFRIIGIDYQYTWIILLMIISTGLNTVFYEIFVSSLKSKKILMPSLIGSIARFPIFVAFVYVFNLPTIGIILAYASMQFISTAYFASYISKMFNNIPTKMENLQDKTKIIFKAGISSWVPYIMTQVGSNIGVLLIFSFKGSSETGTFYIPWMIYGFTIFIIAGIARISQPLVAGMQNKQDQQKFLTHTTKLAFVFTMPIASVLLFFANDFLNLFGRDFGSAYVVMYILMLAIPFEIIASLTYHFIYGLGEHKSVFHYGLINTLTMTVFYFILIPKFGANGAALGYLLGEIAIFIFIFYLARVSNLHLEYKKYFILSTIPMSISSILWATHTNFVLSTLIVLLSSFAIFTRINLFTNDDSHNVLYAVLPKDSADRMYPYIIKIMNRIKSF